MGDEFVADCIVIFFLHVDEMVSDLYVLHCIW